MTELTREALEALIADDDHGLLVAEAKPEPVTNADILANRFEDINRFIDEHQRHPDPDNREDIGEFQLGHRLQAILDNSEYQAVLKHLDRHDLFVQAEAATADSIDDLLAVDDPLLDDLLGEPESETAGLFTHQNIPPPSQEPPKRVARARPCEDFHLFERTIIDCHSDLRTGRRQLKAFSKPSNIKQGSSTCSGERPYTSPKLESSPSKTSA